MTTAQQHKPVRTLRDGALQVAVWENTADDDRVFHTLSFSRAYYDETSEQWKYAENVRLMDAPRLALLLQAAYANQCHNPQDPPDDVPDPEEAASDPF